MEGIKPGLWGTKLNGTRSDEQRLFGEPRALCVATTVVEGSVNVIKVLPRDGDRFRFMIEGGSEKLNGRRVSRMAFFKSRNMTQTSLKGRIRRRGVDRVSWPDGREEGNFAFSLAPLSSLSLSLS